MSHAQCGVHAMEISGSGCFIATHSKIYLTLLHVPPWRTLKSFLLLRIIEMDDPFDDLLNLEEKYYEEGYEKGYADGLKQSRVEAKLFGIEKGYEKFIVMGKLQARAYVWAARLVEHQPEDPSKEAPHENYSMKLPPLQNKARLEKHITTLLALVDSSTLSRANTDDAVGDFDDRLKRAQAKEKVIERIIGEDASGGKVLSGGPNTGSSVAGDMESFGRK